jgi:hypothetical protein
LFTPTRPASAKVRQVSPSCHSQGAACPWTARGTAPPGAAPGPWGLRHAPALHIGRAGAVDQGKRPSGCATRLLSPSAPTRSAQSMPSATRSTARSVEPSSMSSPGAAPAARAGPARPGAGRCGWARPPAAARPRFRPGVEAGFQVLHVADQAAALQQGLAVLGQVTLRVVRWNTRTPSRASNCWIASDTEVGAGPVGPPPGRSCPWPPHAERPARCRSDPSLDWYQ